MKVTVIFLGAIKQHVGQKEIMFALAHDAVLGDLLDEIGRRFGSRMSSQFWDKETRTFKPGIRIISSGHFCESREKPLSDGDVIRVFPGMGGG